jgi:soluble lytic murein transglycosylase-like protein
VKSILFYAFGMLTMMSQSAHAEVFEIAPNGVMTETTNRIDIPKTTPAPTPQTVAEAPQLVGSVSALNRVQTNPYQDMISQTAQQYGLSYELLDSVVWQESRYRADAKSHVGAKGLMQLMPATARSLGVSDAADPAQNLAGGAAYLRIQLNKFDNNLEHALAAYNAGPGAVKKYGGIPPYRETQNYVRSILNRLSQTSLQAYK